MTIVLQVAVTITGAYYLISRFAALIATASGQAIVEMTAVKTGKPLPPGSGANMDKAMGRSVLFFCGSIVWWVPTLILTWII